MKRTRESINLVTIKWNGKEFKDVEVHENETGLSFKKTLHSLTGTAEELVAPKEKIIFVEDIVKDGDEDALLNKYPAGLNNIGNTCYLNACLQNLKSIPEIKNNLKSFTGNQNDLADNLVMRTRDLFTSLEKQNTPYTPFSFVESFRKAYPSFNQLVKTERGDIQAQQDADEFLNSLLSTLRTKSKEIDNLFKGEFEVTFTLTEGKEEATKMKETFHKISCHIEKETSNLEYSLSQSLISQIEKNSPLLGKSAVYTKSSKFSHLPQYLCVNEVRFFWKPKEQIKTKILKDIKFPMILDVYDHCTEDLKKILGPNRQSLRVKREKEILNKFKQEDKMIEEEKPLVEIENGNPTGWYELCGVVTHKGRSADSGHYLGWVKEENGKWMRYDDDVVTEVAEEEISKLSGGGDWHIAYILFYRCKSNGKYVSPK